MFYCNATSDIFLVRSAAEPGTVERARQRSEENRCGAVWRSLIAGEGVLPGNRRWMELLYEVR
jgi:hypothetical protein